MSMADEKQLWAEDLPDGCPPNDALSVDGQSFFRLVESIPPLERDFWSQRKLYPLKKFNTSECIARACSLTTTLDACNRLKKLPVHSHKRVIQLRFITDCGVGKRTGREPSHFSWWCRNGFNPIPCCNELL